MQLKISHYFIIFFLMCFLISCTHKLENTKTHLTDNEKIEITKIQLGLQGKVGAVDKLELYSKTITQNISTDQLLHQKEDFVEFKILQKTLKVDDKNNIYQSVSTTAKDGNMSLHDMAYPELGETISFVFNQKGHVVAAGSFPKDSLFYISPLPLPNREVKVGDTWSYETKWWSEYSSTMMSIEILFVLKKILKCFDNEVCAAIAWNGKVYPGMTDKEVRSVLPQMIESRLQGYAILRLATGTQIWAYIKNSESLKTEAVDLKVFSCVKSVLDHPDVKKEKPYCDPITDKFEFEF